MLAIDPLVGDRPVVPGDPGFSPTTAGQVERRPIRRAVGRPQPQRGALDDTRHPAHRKADVALLAGVIHVQSGGSYRSWWSGSFAIPAHRLQPKA